MHDPAKQKRRTKKRGQECTWHGADIQVAFYRAPILHLEVLDCVIFVQHNLLQPLLGANLSTVPLDLLSHGLA